MNLKPPGPPRGSSEVLAIGGKQPVIHWRVDIIFLAKASARRVHSSVGQCTTTAGPPRCQTAVQNKNKILQDQEWLCEIT